MKTRTPLTLLTIVLFFFCFSLTAQTLKPNSFSPGPGDSVEFTIDLPELEDKTKFVDVSPFYKHLFIFGDGNFRFGESQEIGKFNHLYGPSQYATVQNYYARAYSDGAYSTEDEPPLTGTGPIIPDTSNTIDPTIVVDSNRYLKILRNVQVKPGDPFVSILAVNNPTDVILRGQLYFFYNGKLRTVKKNARTPLPTYSQFQIRDNLFYQAQEVAITYDYTTQGQVNSAYGNMLLMPIEALNPGEELHFFVDMVGDPSMLNVFEATEKAEMDFAVVLGSAGDSPPLTPDSLQAALTDLALPGFLDSLVGLQQAPFILPNQVSIFNPGQDSSSIIDPFPPSQGVAKLVDYYVSTASLVKSHDPNFMLMEACACAEESERYQIFTTVQCENTGYGETDNVYIDIKLPPGVSAEDIVVEPVAYHPYNGADDKISFIELSDDSIRWQLLDFGIEGTPLHGVGDPRTFANVQFHMYSSVEPSALDSIYACIRFDELTNDPVCTVPVAVSMVDAYAKAGQLLQCGPGECGDDPTNDQGWPWWVWALILLLILLLIIWLIRRR